LVEGSRFRLDEPVKGVVALSYLDKKSILAMPKLINVGTEEPLLMEKQGTQRQKNYIANARRSG
jgi:hypothetical protein